MPSIRLPRILALLGVLLSLALGALGRAEDSPAASVLRLLKSGRVPEVRLGTLIDLVAQRGNAEDLRYLYEQTVSQDGYVGKVRLQTLAALADAAQTRKLKPGGSLEGLQQLIDAQGSGVDGPTRLAAIRLAGIWKLPQAAPVLEKLATGARTRPSIRQAAINALLRIGGDPATAMIEKLTAADQPQALRYQGVAALAQLDTKEAAAQAASVLAQGTAETDPAPMIDAFLERQGGADLLAAALQDAKIQEDVVQQDVAKLALRHMYSVGRSDATLVAVLSQLGGISSKPPEVSQEEFDQLLAEVIKNGDPRRGEIVFRRADLSCMKCHAVSKAGGDIGPELSALGSSSPVDYVLKSILFPDQAVKEAFLTHIIATDEGNIYQGIIVDKDDRRLVLKDATGKEFVIPVNSIEEQVEGKSLMPKGLTNFMTRDELIDLARFLSELGKPGEYAIRTTATIQRWKVLVPATSELIEAVPNVETLREQVLAADGGAWQSAYGMVAGTLPLEELFARTKSDVLYLQGEVDVTDGSEVGFSINSTGGLAVWIDAEPFEAQEKIVARLEPGVHKLTLRVDRGQRKNDLLQVEVFRPQGSHAEFTVVGGR